MISEEENWVNENAPKALGINADKLMTTQLFTIVDDADEVVIKEILGIYNHKNAKIILDSHSDGSFEKSHRHIINMCFALVSINTHRRNYHYKFEESKKIATVEMESWRSPYETAIYTQDLTVEVIGALTNLKSSLDSLAQAISVIYGLHGLKTWGKNGDSVLKALKNNIPIKDKAKVDRLITFIKNHQELTKDYIDLRDKLGHGLSDYKQTISGFFKRNIDDDVQNPRVQMGEKVIDCGDLVDGCSKVGTEYCREIVAIILSSIIPGFEVGILNGAYTWSHNIIAVQDIKSSKVEYV